MESYDKLDAAFVEMNENYEDFKASNLEMINKFTRFEDRIKLCVNKDVFESYKKDIQRIISEIRKEMEEKPKPEYRKQKSGVMNNPSNIDTSLFILEDV